MRAAATMGGNLVLAKEQGLQSDVATLMSALQAQVGITSVDKEDLRYVTPVVIGLNIVSPSHHCYQLTGIAPPNKLSSFLCLCHCAKTRLAPHVPSSHELPSVNTNSNISIIIINIVISIIIINCATCLTWCNAAAIAEPFSHGLKLDRLSQLALWLSSWFIWIAKAVPVST